MFYMKLIRLLLLFILMLSVLPTFVGCKKIQEDIGKQFIIKAMTDGRWTVSKFTENGTDDVTDLFTGYEFQFMADGKVHSYYNADIKTGSWEGNTNNLTISSNFPGADDPLKKLNDVWKISNNTTKSVDGTPLNSSRTAFLKLVKKN